MDFSQGLKDRILPVLINRATVFFVSMSVLTLFLYAIGTMQGFVDSTQFALLRFYSILAVFLITTAIFGLVLNVMRYIRQRKKRYIFRSIVYFFLALFGVATVLAVMFIFTMAEGN